MAAPPPCTDRTPPRPPPHVRALLFTASAFIIFLFLSPALALAAGSVFAALDGKGQDEVLQELRSELQDVLAWTVKQRKAGEESQKTLVELLQEQEKAYLESTEVIESDRRDWHGKKVPGLRVKKRLTAGQFGKDYTEKYAKWAANEIRSNMKAFAEGAGEVSAGSYDRLKAALPAWGASSFGHLVSEALGDFGYPQSQFVWDKAVANASTLRDVAVAFARGDPGAALQVLKDAATEKAKEYSKEVIAGTLNWVFSDLNKELSVIEEKLPVSAPTVGELYLKLLEAEIALIDWSDRYLKRAFGGACLDRYVETFNTQAPGGARPGTLAPFHAGAADSAYREFELCSTTGGYAYAFREVEAYITRTGKPAQEVYTQMLEAYRRYYMSPDAWLKRQVTDAKAKAEAPIRVGLRDTQGAVDTIAVGFLGAVRVRLNALAWKKMHKDVKDDLEGKLAGLLADIRPKWERLQRWRGHILAACAAYRAGRGRARSALARAEGIRGRARQVELSAEGIPSCAALPDALGKLEAAAKKADAAQREFDGRVDAMKDAVTLACESADKVKSAATKAEAKDHLDRCQDHARRAAAAIEAARAAAAGLPAIRSEAAQAGGGASAERVAGIRRQVEAMNNALASLEADVPAVEREFAGAKGLMAESIQRVGNVEGMVKGLAQEIVEALKAYRNAPDAMAGGAEAKKILQGAEGALGETGQCVFEITESWNKGDASSGGGAWKAAELKIAPPLGVLLEKVAKAAEDCRAATEASAPADVLARIDAVARAMDAQSVLFDIARKGYERCAAQAIVAYNDAWLKPRTVPSLVGLSTDAAKAQLRGAGLGWTIAAGDPAGSPEKAGTVQSQQPAPGASLERGKSVSLRVYAPSASPPGGEAPPAGETSPDKGRARAAAFCSTQFPNSVLSSYDPTTKKFNCDCPKEFMWGPEKKRCISVDRIIAHGKEVCAKRYPGSILSKIVSAGRYRCNCPKGYRWDDPASPDKKCVAKEEIDPQAAEAIRGIMGAMPVPGGGTPPGEGSSACSRYASEISRLAAEQQRLQAQAQGVRSDEAGRRIASQLTANTSRLRSLVEAARQAGCHRPSASSSPPPSMSNPARGPCHRRPDGTIHCGGG